MTINRGIRITPTQLERWHCLAQQAGVNRNRLLGMLIDNAKIEQKSVKSNFATNEKTVDEVYQSSVNGLGTN